MSIQAELNDFDSYSSSGCTDDNGIPRHHTTTRKPKTHIMAFTAEFKIEAVKNGTCNQTIRPLGKVMKMVGDRALLHGWSGRPYRSPWNWRIQYTNIVKVDNIKFDQSRGVFFYDQGEWCRWDSRTVHWLAVFDGFEGAGDMLAWFKDAHGDLRGKWFQVITWDPEMSVSDRETDTKTDIANGSD